MYLNLQIALLGRGLGWRKWAGLLSVGHTYFTLQVWKTPRRRRQRRVTLLFG